MLIRTLFLWNHVKFDSIFVVNLKGKKIKAWAGEAAGAMDLTGQMV